MCKCFGGSEVVQVRIWTFQVSGSAKCVVLRGVGQPGSDAKGVTLPTRSSVPRHVPPRNSGTGSGPPPGPVLVLVLVTLKLRKRLKQVNCCRL